MEESGVGGIDEKRLEEVRLRRGTRLRKSRREDRVYRQVTRGIEWGCEKGEALWSRRIEEKAGTITESGRVVGLGQYGGDGCGGDRRGAWGEISGGGKEEWWWEEEKEGRQTEKGGGVKKREER